MATLTHTTNSRGSVQTDPDPLLPEAEYGKLPFDIFMLVCLPPFTFPLVVTSSWSRTYVTNAYARTGEVE